MTAVSEGGESVDMDTEGDASHTTEPKEERDDLINPFWIEDRDLGRGEVDYLSGPEVQFWKDLIEKYLFPIDADKTKQVQSKTVDYIIHKNLSHVPCMLVLKLCFLSVSIF